MWELTVFGIDEVLVAVVDLSGVPVDVLRTLCGAEPDDPMLYETEVPPDRLRSLRARVEIPTGEGYRYFMGHVAGSARDLDR